MPTTLSTINHFCLVKFTLGIFNGVTLIIFHIQNSQSQIDSHNMTGIHGHANSATSLNQLLGI